MRQVKAPVMSNKKLIAEFERLDAGTSRRPEARNTLGTWLIELACPEIGNEAKPGQFVMVRCDDLTLPRPFSIHWVKEDRIALLYAVWEDGKGTGWLSKRCEGETVELFGPLGNGFKIYHESRNLLLVAGGVGIAPLYFLADIAAKRGCAVKLHQGVNSAGEVLLDSLRSHFIPTPNLPAGATEYASPTTFESTASTVDGSAGIRGLATVCVPGLAAWADQLFFCGSTGMYQYIARNKRELGLEGKPVQVSLEVRMGCGAGICYGCAIKTRQGMKEVCQDGPVFELDDVLWDELAC